jgi:hypothetical protein
MTTVLGIVAGSTQLAEQCLAITKKLYTTLAAMKEAPELIKLRLDQVQQMTSVSQLIIQNASFQIAQIESILRSCLRSLTKLEKMLLRLSTPKGAGMLKRGFVAFLAVMKEREVEKAFSGLDRDTMTLITCMATIGP